MESAWLLYILVFFNGEPNLEILKYPTYEKCESESVRVKEELEQVYDMKDSQIYCIPYERRDK